MRKIHLKKILFLICFWEFCTLFIVTYDSAVFELGNHSTDYNYFYTLLISIMNCLVGASILGSMEVMWFGKFFRKKPFGFSLFARTFIYLSFILFFISLSTLTIISNEIDKSLLSKDVLNLLLNTIITTRFLLQIIYWGICCFLALFIMQVNEKFGQGVLFNFFTGKYHKPIFEDRVFMFMDLKSSTSIAEKLGHQKYSQLIQNCFYDLTDVVTKYDAEIYQYVGDEVVLSWKYHNEFDFEKCLNTFFSFKEKLEEQKDTYLSKFKSHPEFKAGIHYGKVTVAEVGEIKKELAFHGDAINTSSRIQTKCNELKKELLISDSVNQKISDREQFKISFVDNVLLKGKSHPLGLYEVQKLIN